MAVETVTGFHHEHMTHDQTASKSDGWLNRWTKPGTRLHFQVTGVYLPRMATMCFTKTSIDHQFHSYLARFTMSMFVFDHTEALLTFSNHILTGATRNCYHLLSLFTSLRSRSVPRLIHVAHRARRASLVRPGCVPRRQFPCFFDSTDRPPFFYQAEAVAVVLYYWCCCSLLLVVMVICCFCCCF